MLGMIAADGCISTSKYTNTLSLRLHIKDIKYVERLKKCLEYLGKIGYSKGSPSAGFSVCSTPLFNDLCDKGLSPRKSLIYEFPSFDKVPEKFINSYLLGYFEGDGCICLTKSKDWDRKTVIGIVKICASKVFAEKFKEYIEKTLNITVKIKDSGKSIWYINIDGNLQIEKFLDWLYKGASFVMERKYQKYLEFKQNRKLVESRRQQRAEMSAATLKKNNTNRDYSTLSAQIKKYWQETPNPPQFRRAILQNIKTQEKLNICGIKQFIRENPDYKFHEPSINGLVTGRLKQYKHWILLEKLN
jgi:hypothetical protein